VDALRPPALGFKVNSLAAKMNPLPRGDESRITGKQFTKRAKNGTGTKKNLKTQKPTLVILPSLSLFSSFVVKRSKTIFFIGGRRAGWRGRFDYCTWLTPTQLVLLVQYNTIQYNTLHYMYSTLHMHSQQCMLIQLNFSSLPGRCSIFLSLPCSPAFPLLSCCLSFTPLLCLFASSGLSSWTITDSGTVFKSLTLYSPICSDIDTLLSFFSLCSLLFWEIIGP